MRYAIINLGCKVNRVESDSFDRILHRSGHIGSTLEEAELVIINTCTVTSEAEKKTRKTVRHALRANNSAPVVVTGCAAQIDMSDFTKIDERVKVIHKVEMAEYLGTLGTSDPSQLDDDDVMLSGLRDSRTRVGVKIQDGCDHACTYCIVHVARGKATSVSAHAIIDECVGYAQAGVREIVLTGIDIGSYKFERYTLATLLQALLHATADLHEEDELPVRFRISSIEPMNVSTELIDLIASSEGRICRHLHLPLQSGSDKVLKEMGRPYTLSYYQQLVSVIRDKIPSISLTTDIIVGFPGETEDDFQATLDVARWCAFSKIHVFPYSPRTQTPAAERSDQIDSLEKKKRATKLREPSHVLRAQDYETRIGQLEYAVVEEDGVAKTESYYEIKVDKTYSVGALVPLTLSL